MDRRRWILIPPAVWIASILLIQILGALTAPANSEMPEDCPEESRNCFRSMMGLDGTPQEVHAAAMNWVNSQNRTSVETQAEPHPTPFSGHHGCCTQMISSSKLDARKMERGSKFTLNLGWVSVMEESIKIAWMRCSITWFQSNSKYPIANRPARHQSPCGTNAAANHCRK